jgi:integrase
VSARRAAAAGIAEDRKGWLFRTARGHKADTLSDRAMNQSDAWCMIRRRAKAVGIAAEIGCHTFRATGITAYLANGGALRTRTGNGRAREPAHDQTLRPHQGAADARRGGAHTTLAQLNVLCDLGLLSRLGSAR